MGVKFSMEKGPAGTASVIYHKDRNEQHCWDYRGKLARARARLMG